MSQYPRMGSAVQVGQYAHTVEKKNYTIKPTAALFLLVLTLVLPPSVCSAFDSLDLSQIPEGFRDLAGPQMTVADFYYGERYLISTNIIYTPDTITILDPSSLVRRIQTISHPDTVINALTGEIFSNPGNVCNRQGQDDCGRLTPDVAGVIFNAARFRVDLFIAEPYLSTRSLDQLKYLPESSSQLGMIQGMSAAVSGVSGQANSRDNYSLFGNTLVGWRENHLVSNWDIATEQDFSVDTLYLGRDANGWQLGGGYLDQSGLMSTDFASSQNLLGIRVGSSMNTRLDMANVNASPISIFANGRRRVEVFRDERLIYAANVEAGSQEIDTRSFPQGSYNITVRIYDGTILTQEFTRFFTKSVRLPPVDETLWYLEGGDLTRRVSGDVLPESTGQWLIRGGLGRRLIENIGMEVRGIANKDDTLGETEFYYQGDGWDFTLTGMLANRGGKGGAFETYVPLGPVFLSYYHRRLWNSRYEAGADNENYLLGQGYENHSLSLSTSLMGGSFSASYSYNMQDNRDEPEEMYSASWSKTIMRLAGHDLNLQMRFAQRNSSKIGNLDLTLRRSTRGWNYSARSQNRWNQSDNASSGIQTGYALDSRWYRDDVFNGTGEVGLRYDDLSGDDKTLGGDIRYEQARFLAEANVDHVNKKQGDNYVNYTGRFDTSFAINSTGGAIGGGRASDSAVIIEIEGSEQAVFDVLINGNASGLARGGSRTVMPLSPYGAYGVSIRPRGIEFYDYDQSEKMVVLYPGNVETLNYHSQEELLLLGKLVDSYGDAVQSARIAAEVGFSMTDQFGIFQVRIPSTESQMFVTMADNEECVATIPTDYHKSAGVGLVGEIECL